MKSWPGSGEALTEGGEGGEEETTTIARPSVSQPGGNAQEVTHYAKHSQIREESG